MKRIAGGMALVALAVCGAQDAWAQKPATDSLPWWAKPGAPRARVSRGVGDGFPGELGGVASPRASFRSHPRFAISRAARGERPTSVMLTQYLPPVDTQGKQSSCGAWSTAYYSFTYSIAKRRKWDAEKLADPRYRFSPSFLYNQLNGGKDGGISVEAALDFISQKGCATLAEMPYRDTDITSQPTTDAITRAAQFVSSKPASLFSGPSDIDIEKLKTFLNEMQQPFVTIIPIFNDFPRKAVPADTIYSLTLAPTAENLHGLHAVTIIGYDDARHAFRLVNSWGPRWADGGFLWISEDFLKTYGMDGWSIVPSGLLARDPKARPAHISLAPSQVRNP